MQLSLGLIRIEGDISVPPKALWLVRKENVESDAGHSSLETSLITIVITIIKDEIWLWGLMLVYLQIRFSYVVYRDK